MSHQPHASPVRRGADQPLNPSFPLTVDAARSELKRMAAEPTALERPLVILGGYLDPHFAAAHLRRRLRQVTGDRRVIVLSFFFRNSFHACRGKVIRAVDRAFPTNDQQRTSEVDVVGFSMGGLIARYAGARRHENAADQRHLRIARLFTISTPHRGARMAKLPSLTGLQRDMRIGSVFLRDLVRAADETSFTLYSYVRLRDWIVGEDNAAPEDRFPWWVAKPPLEPSHMVAFRDPRILADIARRLRNEEPLAHEPPAPLPRVDER